MARKPTQRLVKLDVGEVSIVDDPANEIPFHVIKNKNGAPNMSSQPANVLKSLDAIQAEIMEHADVLQKSVDGANISKEMKDKTAALVQNLKGAAKAASEEAKKETEKAKDALAAAEKAMPPGMAPPFGKKPDDEKDPKAAKKNFDGAMVAIMDDGSVHVSSEVSKGRVSKAVVEAMEKSIESQLSLLATTDVDTYKSLMARIAKAELPSNASVSSAVRPQGEGTAPELKAMQKKLDEKDTELTEVKKRLDAIEKTRTPGNGGGDPPATVPVEKKKGMWSGVL